MAAFLIPIVAAVAGAAVSSAGSAKAAKKQREAEIQGRNNAIKASEEAMNRLTGNLSDADKKKIFGSKPNATFPKSVAQDLTENIGQIENQGLPAAQRFTERINEQLSDDTVRFNTERIESFVPNFQDTVQTIGNSANDLVHGRLPTDVFQNVVGNTVGGANMLGTPGGAFPAVLKDLGLTTLDAMQRGQESAQSLFGSLATSISPTPNFLGAQSLLPFTSLNADQRVTQELAVTRATQAAELIAAMPDPAERELFLNEFSVSQRNAGLLAGGVVPDYGAGIGAQAAGAGITAAGAAYTNQQNQAREDARFDAYIKALNNSNQGGTPSTAGAG